MVARPTLLTTFVTFYNVEESVVMSIDFRSGVKLGDLRRKLWSRYRSNTTFLVPSGKSVLGFAGINAQYDLDNFLQNELPARLKELDFRFDFEVIQSGSFTEGVSLFRKHSQYETVEQEYDFLFLLKSLKVDSNENVQRISVVEGGSEAKDKAITQGHSWIRLNDIDLQATWQDCVIVRQNEFFLSSTKIVEVLQSRIEEVFRKSSLQENCAYRFEVNGPAVTVVMDLRDTTGTQITFSFDFVLALDWNEWPICAEEWITRDRKWPDQTLVAKVINSGVYLVPKASKCGDPELEWRISFSKPEKVLFSLFPKPRGEYTIPGCKKSTYDHLLIPDASCRIECYRILKEMFKEHLSIPKILSSYHLKTIMLWACEKHPEDFWESANSAVCFLGLLDDLLHCLATQQFQQFFVPSVNLLQQNDYSFLFILARKVSLIRTKPLQFIKTHEDELGIQVTYSDSFIEDSERAQLEAMKTWFTGAQNTSQVEVSTRISYSYQMTGKSDPSRVDNTYLRDNQPSK